MHDLRMDHLKDVCKLAEAIAKDAATTKHKALSDSSSALKDKLTTLSSVKTPTPALPIVCALLSHSCFTHLAILLPFTSFHFQYTHPPPSYLYVSPIFLPLHPHCLLTASSLPPLSPLSLLSPFSLHPLSPLSPPFSHSSRYEKGSS